MNRNLIACLFVTTLLTACGEGKPPSAAANTKAFKFDPKSTSELKLDGQHAICKLLYPMMTKEGAEIIKAGKDLSELSTLSEKPIESLTPLSILVGTSSYEVQGLPPLKKTDPIDVGSLMHGKPMGSMATIEEKNGTLTIVSRDKDVMCAFVFKH